MNITIINVYYCYYNMNDQKFCAGQSVKIGDVIIRRKTEIAICTMMANYLNSDHDAGVVAFWNGEIVLPYVAKNVG